MQIHEILLLMVFFDLGNSFLYYLLDWQSYSSRLASLKFEDPVTKDNLMGNEESSGKQSIFSKTTSLRNKGTTFTIGNRGEILNQQLEAPILVPHAQQNIHYSYEALFRSEQYALVDNACREYLFGTEFFIVHGTQAQDLFNQIMGKTMTLLIVCIEFSFMNCDIFCVWAKLKYFVCLPFRKMWRPICKIAMTALRCSCAFN